MTEENLLFPYQTNLNISFKLCFDVNISIRCWKNSYAIFKLKAEYFPNDLHPVIFLMGVTKNAEYIELILI